MVRIFLFFFFPTSRFFFCCVFQKTLMERRWVTKKNILVLAGLFFFLAAWYWDEKKTKKLSLFQTVSFTPYQVFFYLIRVFCFTENPIFQEVGQNFHTDYYFFFTHFFFPCFFLQIIFLNILLHSKNYVSPFWGTLIAPKRHTKW